MVGGCGSERLGANWVVDQAAKVARCRRLNWARCVSGVSFDGLFSWMPYICAIASSRRPSHYSTPWGRQTRVSRVSQPKQRATAMPTVLVAGEVAPGEEASAAMLPSNGSIDRPRRHCCHCRPPSLCLAGLFLGPLSSLDHVRELGITHVVVSSTSAAAVSHRFCCTAVALHRKFWCHLPLPPLPADCAE